MTKGLVFPLVLITLPAVAEDYQLFTGASANYQNVGGYSEDGYRADAQYFFDRKTALGPLDQFEYINTVSNITASTVHFGDRQSASVSGAHFAGKVAVSGGVYASEGDYSASIVSAGYLFSDDLIVRAHATHVKDKDTSYALSTSYNMPLNASDYLGATLSVGDAFDSPGVNVKYFNAFANGRYLAFKASYHNNWRAEASYYISDFTGFSLGLDRGEVISAGMRHFFTRSFAVGIRGQYREADSYLTPEYKAYVLSLSWQI